MDLEALKAAHRHSSRHRDELGRSASAGCFHCLATYPSPAIVDWIDGADGTETALCPECGIDSVIGDASGLPATDAAFLKEMHAYWFAASTERASFDLDDPGQLALYATAFEVVPLYRPVGQEELDLIEKSGFSAFPPRLPEQPIFSPVTNEAYATQIARDWNTRLGTRRGYVTRFMLRGDYAQQFERHVVGGAEHEELWVPAEDLAEFNRNIFGKIAVIASFKGDAG